PRDRATLADPLAVSLQPLPSCLPCAGCDLASVCSIGPVHPTASPQTERSGAEPTVLCRHAGLGAESRKLVPTRGPRGVHPHGGRDGLLRWASARQGSCARPRAPVRERSPEHNGRNQSDPFPLLVSS